MGGWGTRSPADEKRKIGFGYERSKRRTYLTYENCYERLKRRTYLRGGPQECRRFARARRTAARRHGLLPSAGRSSASPSAHPPLWLRTRPSWARPCRPCACCALRLTVLTHDALCVRVQDPAEYVFASQSRAPQGRLKSPKFKSGLQTEFQIWW